MLKSLFRQKLSIHRTGYPSSRTLSTDDPRPHVRGTHLTCQPSPSSGLPSYAAACSSSLGASEPGSAACVASAKPTGDDALSLLSEFDIILLIDDSASMVGHKWRNTAAALESILETVIQHDQDGIDIYFLNQRQSSKHMRVREVEAVRGIFQSVSPRGGTPLGMRLDGIIRPYLDDYRRSQRKKPTPMNIICFTDGAPTDDLKSAIVSAAKTLDELRAPAWQLGIQFFQIGDDPEAAHYLSALDNDLEQMEGVRDIVDTVSFRGLGWDMSLDNFDSGAIGKVVLGAVDRRWDRQGAPAIALQS